MSPCRRWSYSLIPNAPSDWQMQLLVGTVRRRLLWFRVAFSLANKPERFLQTSTAIFGDHHAVPCRRSFR